MARFSQQLLLACISAYSFVSVSSFAIGHDSMHGQQCREMTKLHANTYEWSRRASLGAAVATLATVWSPFTADAAEGESDVKKVLVLGGTGFVGHQVVEQYFHLRRRFVFGKTS